MTGEHPAEHDTGPFRARSDRRRASPSAARSRSSRGRRTLASSFAQSDACRRTSSRTDAARVRRPLVPGDRRNARRHRARGRGTAQPRPQDPEAAGERAPRRGGAAVPEPRRQDRDRGRRRRRRGSSGRYGGLDEAAALAAPVRACTGSRDRSTADSGSPGRASSSARRSGPRPHIGFEPEPEPETATGACPGAGAACAAARSAAGRECPGAYRERRPGGRTPCPSGCRSAAPGAAGSPGPAGPAAAAADPAATGTASFDGSGI